MAREWKRADMAVVRDGDAIVVIESTALYAFDVLRELGLHKYSSSSDHQPRSGSNSSPSINPFAASPQPSDVPFIASR